MTLGLPKPLPLPSSPVSFPQPRTMASVVLENLTKVYPDKKGPGLRVVHGIDLEVRPGEMVCIEGPSGSGKSTLLNVLGLLEDPDGGEVWFGDQPVSRLSRSAKSRERGRWLGWHNGVQQMQNGNASRK